MSARLFAGCTTPGMRSPDTWFTFAASRRFEPTRGRPPSRGHGWAGEKLVLHKLRFHPDFVAPFPPLANFEVALLESRPYLPYICPDASLEAKRNRRQTEIQTKKGGRTYVSEG